MSDERPTIDPEEPAKEDEVKKKLEGVVERKPFIVKDSGEYDAIRNSIRKQIKWQTEHPEE